MSGILATAPYSHGVPSRRRLLRRVILGALALAALLITALLVTTAAHASSRVFSGIGVTSDGGGYGLVATSGENYDFGSVQNWGNPSGFTGSIVAVAVTADGKGYVEVSSTGQVYAYGSVKSWGNPSGFSGSITGIAVTADGSGYIVVSSTGQTYCYGSVKSWGNPAGFSGSIVGVSVTADGQGYAEVSSAGQNYDYGTVKSWGNPSGFSGSIVGVSVTADGQGYANVSSTGQNYDYGTVKSWGNPSGFSGPIVGVSVTANGQGYADLSGTGQVYAYGSVHYWGNGDSGDNGLGSRIASQASGEAANPAHNREEPMGSNCNFYTTALGAGRTSGTCSQGWHYEPWCADFARWLWGAEGANTGGLTGAAVSFESYGKAHHTWSGGSALAGIAPGDVILWDYSTGYHVSVVASVNSNKTVNLVEGNWSNIVHQRTISPGAAYLVGYTSPVS